MAKEPKIYLFDMDHTLIDNDCDVSWKQFVVRHNLQRRQYNHKH